MWPGPGPGSILIITVGRRRPPPGTNIIATKLHLVISLLMPTPETIYSHDYCPAENTNHIKDTTIDDCKMSERASINVDYVGRSLVHIRHIHDLLLLSTLVPTLWSQSDIFHKQTSRITVKQPSITEVAMFFFIRYSLEWN